MWGTGDVELYGVDDLIGLLLQLLPMRQTLLTLLMVRKFLASPSQLWCSSQTCTGWIGGSDLATLLEWNPDLMRISIDANAEGSSTLKT